MRQENILFTFHKFFKNAPTCSEQSNLLQHNVDEQSLSFHVSFLNYIHSEYKILQYDNKTIYITETRI